MESFFSWLQTTPRSCSQIKNIHCIKFVIMVATYSFYVSAMCKTVWEVYACTYCWVAWHRNDPFESPVSKSAGQSQKSQTPFQSKARLLKNTTYLCQIKCNSYCLVAWRNSFTLTYNDNESVEILKVQLMSNYRTHKRARLDTIFRKVNYQLTQVKS